MLRPESQVQQWQVAFSWPKSWSALDPHDHDQTRQTDNTGPFVWIDGDQISLGVEGGSERNFRISRYFTARFLEYNSQLVKRCAVNSKIQKHDDVAMLVNPANTNQHINLSLPERNFPTITGLMYTWIIVTYYKSFIQLVKARRRSKVEKRTKNVAVHWQFSTLRTRQESVCLRPRS